MNCPSPIALLILNEDKNMLSIGARVKIIPNKITIIPLLLIFPLLCRAIFSEIILTLLLFLRCNIVIRINVSIKMINCITEVERITTLASNLYPSIPAAPPIFAIEDSIV